MLPALGGRLSWRGAVTVTTRAPIVCDVSELVAVHGSPLWMAYVDRARANLSRLRAAFDAAWPDVHVAYSYKTNRLGVFLDAFARDGALAEVVCEAEHALARRHGVPGDRIVVNGPVKTDRLLEAAAASRSLVIVDSVEEVARALAARVTRLGVRVSQPGATGATSRFGVPVGEVPAVAALVREGGGTLETLHAHAVSTDLVDTPGPDVPLASRVQVRWPRPADDHVRLATVLGALARRLSVPAVDLGGGQPGGDDIDAHARSVAAALRETGFDGTLMVEPGRALVADAVDLAATVAAARALPDGRSLVVLDAGVNLLPGALWAWPHVEAVDRDGPVAPTLVSGPLCLNIDILHPAAPLPVLEPGDTLVFRGVGAYHQAQSTQFGDTRPAVIARADGRWLPVRRRETVGDLVAAETDPRTCDQDDAHRGPIAPLSVVEEVL